jgi:hypothetical protein
MAAALAAAGMGIASPSSAGGSQVITVSAAVLSNSNCQFRAGTVGLLSLPAIDPSQSTTFSTTGTLIIRCAGAAGTASYGISNNNGLYGAGPTSLRMRHSTQTTQFLDYSLSYPATGTTPKNANTTLTITASVSQSAYQDAVPGSYQDTVVLTISP